MAALYMLIAVAIIVIWFLLSPLFSKIGKGFSDLMKNITTENIERKEEKETDDEK